MNEDQNTFFSRRLKAAAEEHPEIETLRTRLLEIGGLELVPPQNADPDVPALIADGEVVTGPMKLELMDESRCHENLSELWIKRGTGLTAIGTGYALSEDGLWRQHPWGIRDGEIIETTKERATYFGIVLQGSAADAFAEANQGDPKERRWRRLPEVHFRLQKDQDGYPPKDWESLKAEPADEPNTFRIKSIPFFDRHVAYDDEVLTCTSPEGWFPVFQAVTKRGGYSTVRLLMSEDEDENALASYFTNRDCLVEFRGRLVAIGIPRDAFEQVSKYIGAEMDRGRWGAEDGYLVIGEAGVKGE